MITMNIDVMYVYLNTESYCILINEVCQETLDSVQY